MGYSKKTGKGRLDKYYHLAKEQGYRARSAFKLVQLNKKYGFLQQSRVVIDLCAAPGGWCQVAAKYMPKSKIIIGVDLAPIKPISGVITMVNDITTDKCRVDIKRELKDWKADVVLHDGAPNVGKAWLQDAYTQSELVLSSLKLATEFLVEGGWFVTKVFRSKDYNSLLWVFNQLFTKVEATKPSSSRDVSAEIFVVCKGFKAPKSIDPRFLDPRHVFTDVDALMMSGSGAGGAKTNVLHPDKKKRHREGYEDDANILFKSQSVLEFIKGDRFMDMLAELNSLHFTPADDEEIKYLSIAPETTDEVKACCQDLKVLGRREFKLLIKWRLQMRKHFGIAEPEKPGSKKSSTEAAEGNTEETLTPEQELENLNASLQKRAKRERRKTLERKAKQRMRLNLQMENANDLADDVQDSGLFSLKKVAKAAVKSRDEVNDEDLKISDSEEEDGSGFEEEQGDDEDDYLESDDEKYSRMEASFTQPIAIKKKKTTSEIEASSPIVVDSSNTEDLPTESLLTSLQKPEEEASAQKAKVSLWYSNPLFQSMAELTSELAKHQPAKKTKKTNRSYQESPLEAIKAEIEPVSEEQPRKSSVKNQKKTDSSSAKANNKKASSTAIEMVQVQDPYAELFESGEVKDILKTLEGMSYAQRLASASESGDRSSLREDLIDETFNRYAFGEKPSDLPDWFLQDESKHNKPIKPITREVADALKAQAREINDRPIKKILEAKGRSKARLIKKVEGLKRKAENIMGAEEGAEKAKLIQIAKMLRNPKIKKEKPALIVARGSAKGLKGRPKGVKGRYKMVDSRMKKELRAEKLRAQKQKKKSKK